ncbi:MAG: phage holin family protein [Candidatus Gottesmanbacteria bacterium]
MKTILRVFVFSLFALWLTTNLIDGLKISGGYQNIIFGSIVLGIINLFIKPILKILFFPVNLLSLGLLSWIINIAVLYILTIFVPQVSISSWQFPGISYQGIVVPAYFFNQIFAFIIIALVLSGIINFLTWLAK